MTIGPVEDILVGFPGNQFRDEIVPALADLIESRTIHVVDLAFIKKDANGSMTTFEYHALEETAAFEHLDGEAGGILNDDDLQLAASTLLPDSSAALLLWEDLWAKPLLDTLRGAGGELIAGARIPHDVVDAAVVGLPAAE